MPPTLPKPPNLKPTNAPSAPTGVGPIDAIAARLAITPAALAGLLSDPKVQQAIADAISAHTGSTPEEGNAVEQQLARDLSRQPARLAKALAFARTTAAAKKSARR